MRIAAVSDIHMSKPALPDGDVLVVAGDLTNIGSPAEWREQCDWIADQMHPTKIVIAGNHDFAARKVTWEEMLANWRIDYLLDRELEVDGVRFYGSPWTPIFGAWSFMGTRGFLRATWGRIPEGLDVLITHGPPRSVLDGVYDPLTMENDDHVGCPDLDLRLIHLGNRGPRHHIFGHIHEWGGESVAGPFTTFHNVAHSPKVIDL